MPLPPAPPPRKPYLTLHLIKHAGLLKKVSNDWYWGDNWGKFFHACDTGHQLEIHEHLDTVGGCPNCLALLPEELVMLSKLQKLRPRNQRRWFSQLRWSLGDPVS